MKVVSGVYSIQNNITGRLYIGSSKDIHKRWREHKSNLFNHTHHSMDLQNDWDKYGEDNFSFNILLETDIANALKMEREYIDKMQTERFGYNVSKRGGFKDNFIKRTKMKYELLKEAIKGYYIPDGNSYQFEIHEITNKAKLSISDLIKLLRVDYYHNILNPIKIDDETVAMLNWDKDNIYLSVTNAPKYEEKVSKGLEPEMIIVGDMK